MSRYVDYVYIFATIAFGVYGSIITKWRLSKVTVLPERLSEKVMVILPLFLDPAIMSSVLATILGALMWMIAMTKFKLSEAYPFLGLNFVGILLLSAWFLGESITPQKIAGVSLIVLGLVVSHL